MTLDRRTLLRGAIGGAAIHVALPPLEAMLNANGTALAAGGPIPRRFGVFFYGNGVRPARWIPAQTGAAWTPSEQLAPLAPVKEYVNVVTGTNIVTGSNGHKGGTVGILSGAPYLGSDSSATYGIPTIDQVAARELGQATRFRSLELGVSREIYTSQGTATAYLSHNGPNSPNPPEYDPKAAFDRLFGAGFQGAPGSSGTAAPAIADRTLALRRSILDAVAADAQGLRARLGHIDKQRLDQHLEGIRALEKRLAALEVPGAVPAACQRPAAPSPVGPFKKTSEALEPVMAAMAELVVMALVCDLTRVFSIMFTGAVGNTVFWQVGATGGIHKLTHDESGDQPTVHAAVVFTMKQFAHLLSRLKATPDGAGNLLDSSVVLGLTEHSSGFEHSLKDLPILIAGRGGGSLRHPGVHYRSATKENTSKALLTALRAAGVMAPEFGGGPGKTSQTIPDVLAA